MAPPTKQDGDGKGRGRLEDDRSHAWPAHAAKKHHHMTVTIKQCSQFNFEHNYDRFDPITDKPNHREGATNGFRRERNPIVKDVFRSQF